MAFTKLAAAGAGLWASVLTLSLVTTSVTGAAAQGDLDAQLAAVLKDAGFTGAIERTIPARLGRHLNPALVSLGRFLFFDPVLALHEDNACAGCHSPAFAFADSQPIAIGVQSNRIVGPNRIGPRNQRRAPSVVNSAFFRRLMWDGRFEALSGDPFNNSLGFKFPKPEGNAVTFFPGNPNVPTLLSAQGHMPSTELPEMAGFNGARTNPFFQGTPFGVFDDGVGAVLPADANHNGFLNEEIRDRVLTRVNAIDAYVSNFARLFNGGTTSGFRVDFDMIGMALGEFQTSLTMANAPIDRFALGFQRAMSEPEKRGALLFFGAARPDVNCVQCHAVAGAANEMFSDFENHVLAVPQVAPAFGAGLGNVPFGGPDADQDFGAFQTTQREDDLYRFRTAPLRNVGRLPFFFHDGAFSRLEDAIRHHLDVPSSVRSYNPAVAGVPLDLTRLAAADPMLDRLDPRAQAAVSLSEKEFNDLTAFVRNGLLDPRATPMFLCRLVPDVVPSGLPVLQFEGCPR